MKLNCTIEVATRSNVHSKKKPVKSTLSLIKLPKSEEPIFVLFTNANKVGTKYKIKNNIVDVLTRFVNEGKTTIRFKVPDHDFLIQAESVQLKSFLKIFKSALEGKVPLKSLGLSNITATKSTNKVVTKSNIQHRSEIPKHGYPRTLEILCINDISLINLDRQILYLQHLKVLDLSHNCIIDLPRELQNLPLCELTVSYNLLGQSKIKNWPWLSGKLLQTLKMLDVSHNELYYLTPNISCLKHLYTLKVNDNNLSMLPQSLGKLKGLRHLNISKNKLTCVPWTVSLLNLNEFDVSANNFIQNKMSGTIYERVIKPQTLLELSATLILKKNIHYDAKIIPATIIDFINESLYCKCGNLFNEKILRVIIEYNASQTRCFISTDRTPLPMECFPCSVKCLKIFFS